MLISSADFEYVYECDFSHEFIYEFTYEFIYEFIYETKPLLDWCLYLAI